MGNKTFSGLNRRNSLYLLLEILWRNRLETSPRTVRVYGRTRVSEKDGNPVRTVDSQTNQSIYTQLRSQEIWIFYRNPVLRLEVIIEIRNERREQGQECLVEYTVERRPLFLHHTIGLEVALQCLNVTGDGLFVQILPVRVQPFNPGNAFKHQLGNIGILDIA